MDFISTRSNEKVNAAQAIVSGLASDGGLFVPSSFPKIGKEEYESLAEMNYADRVAYVLFKFFEELGEEFLKDACQKAFAGFEGTDEAPLVKIDGGVYVLELFHGPTCSYKDVSLTLLPYLLEKSAQLEGIKEDLFLLIASNGDTGKSAMEAFRDRKGMKLAVFYPDEGVAKMQRLQLSVQDGKNLFSCAVKASFDDCQRMVRGLFKAGELAQELAKRGMRLTSANSYNFARIAPQIAYYFSAYIDLVTSDQIEMGEEIDFVAPTGDFGNVLAGWYAKKMGLPIRKIVCASNRNRTLTEFLKTGSYEFSRPVHRTMSPSMDVALVSNVERLVFEVSGRNAKQTADRMKGVQEKKGYSLTQKELSAIREDIYAGFASEDDTVEAMYEIFDEYGYAMDTHTGVGVGVYNKYTEKMDKKDMRLTVLLATGHPYKFPQDVLYALSGNDVKDCFKGIKRLNLLTAMKPPKPLVELRYRPLRFKGVVANDPKAITALVLELADGKIVPVPDEK